MSSDLLTSYNGYPPWASCILIRYKRYCKAIKKVVPRTYPSHIAWGMFWGPAFGYILDVHRHRLISRWICALIYVNIFGTISIHKSTGISMEFYLHISIIVCLWHMNGYIHWYVHTYMKTSIAILTDISYGYNQWLPDGCMHRRVHIFINVSIDFPMDVCTDICTYIRRTQTLINSLVSCWSSPFKYQWYTFDISLNISFDISMRISTDTSIILWTYPSKY